MTHLIDDVALAEILGVSRYTVQRNCRARTWPHMRVARGFRFGPDHVTAILAMHEVVPAVAPTPAAQWGRKSRKGVGL